MPQGPILWAATFGFGGYFFGKLLFQLHSAVAPVVFVLALGAFFGIGYLIHRYEHRLLEEAERSLPGPLDGLVTRKK